MEKWWKNKEKVSGPWKNKAFFLFFSLKLFPLFFHYFSMEK